MQQFDECELLTLLHLAKLTQSYAYKHHVTYVRLWESNTYSCMKIRSFFLNHKHRLGEKGSQLKVKGFSEKVLKPFKSVYFVNFSTKRGLKGAESVGEV